MSGLVLVSIIAIIFLTYKLTRVLKNKEAPKSNRRIAWSLYGFSVIALVIVNILFS
ncbi:hypothetical protein SAMN05192534_1574 [Alteribacillus persepolensis]|uniref:Uncharacterized protein n=1 Tax=Alteribacillus persepolensis TaxID=568899 RepID=A0A1G8KMR9_9BACI|nr:hypothetical protein SAMN05192534_1574 [Alteribacillus persepolensis]